MIQPAAAVSLLLVLLLQLWSVEAQVGGGGAGSPPARCPDKCGEVSVPYPFGIRDGCFLPGFGLTCNTTTNPPRLMLGNGTLQVVEISLANSTLRAVDLASAVNITYDVPPNGNGKWASLGVAGGAGSYVVSEKRNRLVVTGCNVQETLAGENTNVITGCSSFCPISEMFTSVATTNLVPNAGDEFSCSGTACCETPIAIGRPSYLVNFSNLDPNNQELTGRLPIAVRIAENGWFEGVAGELLNNSNTTASLQKPVPVVLDWVVSSTLEAVLQGITGQFADDRNWSCPTAGAARKSACISSDSFCSNVTGNYRRGYVCKCRRGYDGNPYVAGGCQDIDECKLAGKCFGECTNTLGDYECRCPRGARGNASIPYGCVKTNLGLSVGIGVGSGAGLLVMALCAAFLTRQIKNRRARMLQQNRGHLLQQLVSQKADIAEKMIIPLAELEKATNNFDASRELGGGGHGTVYKGILSDLHVAAIKKSKVAIQREIDEFINDRSMMIPVTAALLVVVLLQLVCSTEAQVAVVVGTGPPAGCPDRCGDVDVPFPFGIRDGCFLDGFALTCNTGKPPRLMIGNTTLQVVNISLANSTLRAVDIAGAVNITYGSIDGNGTWAGVAGAGGDGGPYVVSEDLNQLLVTGCNILVTLYGRSGNVITGCSSMCAINDWWAGGVFRTPRDKCSGIGCCQTLIPIGRTTYRVELTNLDKTRDSSSQVLEAVRIAERGWFDGVAADLLQKQSLNNTSARIPVPVVLEWTVASTPVIIPGMPQFDNSSCPTAGAARKSACMSTNSNCVNVTGNYRTGYVCQCKDGYQGNPYIAGGCQDIDECKRAEGNGCFGECINTPGAFLCRCPRGASGNASIPNGCVKSKLGLTIGIGIGSGAGLFIIALGAVFLTRKIKHRRERMLRHKFFRQNRGHLLQQLVSQKADIAERMIITLTELEKATNNFDESRELGGGGHGTVYKGILSDLHVVAIKKSKMSIQREIDEFINEVAILSQINHRNVVKLFGCCLETEVPLLVYEFISNGTLYHHLHVEGPRSLPWEDRLRIATETARALAYLHSAVAFPIIHRDIKSQNILLDGSLTTKVSDFGASRCIPSEKTGVTTAIQGTLGYLDPMYYYTGRLTEKSDVFSFGVVLIELLTRKKPYSYRSPEDDGLVAYFTALLTHGNLGDILDTQVKEEGGEDVKEVAMLAVACVKLKAEERPTMRQVEMTLESVRSSSLQQEVLHSVEAKKSKENHVSWSYPVSKGTSMQSTRQYSLEEEYLLSSKYPR